MAAAQAADMATALAFSEAGPDPNAGNSFDWVPGINAVDDANLEEATALASEVCTPQLLDLVREGKHFNHYSTFSRNELSPETRNARNNMVATRISSLKNSPTNADPIDTSTLSEHSTKRFEKALSTFSPDTPLNLETALGIQEAVITCFKFPGLASFVSKGHAVLLALDNAPVSGDLANILHPFGPFVQNNLRRLPAAVRSSFATPIHSVGPGVEDAEVLLRNRIRYYKSTTALANALAEIHSGIYNLLVQIGREIKDFALLIKDAEAVLEAAKVIPEQMKIPFIQVITRKANNIDIGLVPLILTMLHLECSPQGMNVDMSSDWLDASQFPIALLGNDTRQAKVYAAIKLTQHMEQRARNLGMSDDFIQTKLKEVFGNWNRALHLHADSGSSHSLMRFFEDGSGQLNNPRAIARNLKNHCLTILREIPSDSASWKEINSTETVPLRPFQQPSSNPTRISKEQRMQNGRCEHPTNCSKYPACPKMHKSPEIQLYHAKKMGTPPPKWALEKLKASKLRNEANNIEASLPVPAPAPAAPTPVKAPEVASIEVTTEPIQQSASTLESPCFGDFDDDDDFGNCSPSDYSACPGPRPPDSVSMVTTSSYPPVELTCKQFVNDVTGAQGGYSILDIQENNLSSGTSIATIPGTSTHFKSNKSSRGSSKGMVYRKKTPKGPPMCSGHPVTFNLNMEPTTIAPAPTCPTQLSDNDLMSEDELLVAGLSISSGISESTIRKLADKVKGGINGPSLHEIFNAFHLRKPSANIATNENDLASLPADFRGPCVKFETHCSGLIQDYNNRFSDHGNWRECERKVCGFEEILSDVTVALNRDIVYASQFIRHMRNVHREMIVSGIDTNRETIFNVDSMSMNVPAGSGPSPPEDAASISSASNKCLSFESSISSELTPLITQLQLMNNDALFCRLALLDRNKDQVNSFNLEQELWDISKLLQTKPPDIQFNASPSEVPSSNGHQFNSHHESRSNPFAGRSL